MKIGITFPIIFLFASIVMMMPLGHAAAQGAAPSSESQKIEALIKQVGDLKEVKIVRNGWSYEPSTAVRFLYGKWAANRGEIKTARDFIEKIASFSGTSGKPYLIHFKDGHELKSREFLLAELKKIESVVP